MSNHTVEIVNLITPPVSPKVGARRKSPPVDTKALHREAKKNTIERVRREVAAGKKYPEAFTFTFG